jgi:rod shape-determining protein MreD
MRRTALVIFCGLCVVLQVSFLPALRPLGVVPNLMLPLVVLMGLEGTASLAVAAAVIGGVLVDLASGANFGLWTAVLVLAAVVTGLVHRAGFELVTTAATAIVAAGTLLMALVVLSGLAPVVSHWPWGGLLLMVATELVLNLILTIVLRPLVRMLAGGVQAETLAR